MDDKDAFKDMENIFRSKAKGFSESLGCAVKETYGPEDINDVDFERDLGKPGEYPFTRGIYHRMYRQRPWIMRELTGFATPGDTRKRTEFLEKLGGGGLNVICDNPTYKGIDSDHPLAKSAVGKAGVPLSSLLDMEEMLDGVPLDRINSSIVISTAPSIIIFAQYVAVAEKRGIPLEKLRGTIQNEPILGRYRGHLPSCRQ